MKFKHLVLLGCLLFATKSFAQRNLLNAKHPDQIGKMDEAELQETDTMPLPYGYISDRQILWGENVWEYIDLNQKVNFPLLYPLDTNNTGAYRKPLFLVLINNIKNGNIKNIYSNSYFSRKVSFKDLQASLHFRDTLQGGIKQLNAGEKVSKQFIRRVDVQPSDVQGYRIRGFWYFDARRGALRWRLVGICPMVTGAYAKANQLNQPPVALFWVFYPEVRKVLYNSQVFNNDNSAHPMNFDELLTERRFNAVIYQVDNTYGNRSIDDYIKDNALLQLLTARRLKKHILHIEENMWNY